MANRKTNRSSKQSPREAKPATEPQKELAAPEPGQTNPEGRIDVTGMMPEGIRIDPDITEGHPGYEESGDSEIIPPERFSGADKKDKPAH